MSESSSENDRPIWGFRDPEIDSEEDQRITNIVQRPSSENKKAREKYGKKYRWWGHETEKKATTDSESTDGREEGTRVRRFRYRDLVNATGNFSNGILTGRKNVTVFSLLNRREWEQTGKSMPEMKVAIKRFNAEHVERERKYKLAMERIGSLSHPNVAPLLGWCHHRKKKKLLTIYEYMPNGCLSHYLQRLSPWTRRYTIAKGIASALKYFFDIPMLDRHEIHPNIKPSNVLLDSHYKPMLKDFEITRLEEIKAMLPATTNDPYIDPEIMKLGVMSEKPHIYSFGVVLMELACGSRIAKGFPLVEWVPAMFRDCLHRQEDERSRSFLLKLADEKLSDLDMKEMHRLLRVGLLCTNPMPEKRPSMDRVHLLLEFLEDLPPMICEPEHSMDVDSVGVIGVADEDDDSKIQATAPGAALEAGVSGVDDKIQATTPDTAAEAGVSGVTNNDSNMIRETTPYKALEAIEALLSRLHRDPEAPRTESFRADMQEIEARFDDLSKQLASKQRERKTSHDQLEDLRQLVRKLDDDCRSIEEQRDSLVRDANLKLFERLSSHIN